MADRGFTAKRMCEITGVTYRQLDYWHRTGLVSPSVRPADGSGSVRRYSYRDALVVALIGELLAEGHRLPRTGGLIAELASGDRPIAGLLFATPTGAVSDEPPSGLGMYWCINLDRLAAKVTAAIGMVSTVDSWASGYAPEPVAR